MKNLKFLFPLLLFVLSFTACNDNDEITVLETQTIADLASASPKYSLLVQALQRADLVTALAGTTEYTVLAPNNDAFQAFLDANEFESINEIPLGLLTQVLLNHVINGSLLSTDLSTGYANTLATSEASNSPISIYIDTNNGVRFNNVASVVLGGVNVEADNGVIHEVDAVIGLPTVVTFATADTNFGSLVTALTRETSFNYVETLSGTNNAPFTVFAPTNQAFSDLVDELQGVNSLADIPTATLEATLNTHVAAGANVLAGSLTNGQTINTLGDTFEITLNGMSAGFSDLNGRTGMITATDVQANNGVIHVVNTVILPDLN